MSPPSRSWRSIFALAGRTAVFPASGGTSASARCGRSAWEGGHVAAEHVLEVAPAEDQQPVETLGADGTHEPVGFANSGGLVFVDESAEQIAAAKVGRRCQRRRVAPVRWEQLQRAVGPVLVVMAPVGAEHMFEMAAAEDE